jgi:hypothetical protein
VAAGRLLLEDKKRSVQNDALANLNRRSLLQVHDAFLWIEITRHKFLSNNQEHLAVRGIDVQWVRF